MALKQTRLEARVSGGIRAPKRSDGPTFSSPAEAAAWHSAQVDLKTRELSKQKDWRVRQRIGDEIQEHTRSIAVEGEKENHAKAQAAQAQAEAVRARNIQAERDLLQGLASNPEAPMTAAQYAYADDLINRSNGRITAEQARAEAIGSPKETPRDPVAEGTFNAAKEDAEATAKGLPTAAEKRAEEIATAQKAEDQRFAAEERKTGLKRQAIAAQYDLMVENGDFNTVDPVDGKATFNRRKAEAWMRKALAEAGIQ